ncbi:hypothetical protein [Chryseobacterium foetidum]|uniref:hypothetical protein n=1 Tax=Chryseobacterium foetidum TaxID=2951057 RepID=UPI0021C9C128|nr:hypothetical protein [Chryseobacterium foetidum]
MMQKILPDLLSYIPILSLIAIAFYLYFSNRISKEKVNHFLLLGLIFTVVSHVFQYYVTKYLVLQYDSFDSASGIKKWYPVMSLLGGFGYKLIFYGIITYLLKFEILKNDIKRENIFLLIIYSVLSFGLYIPYWFIKKNIKFNGNLTVWIILMIFFLSCSHVSVIHFFDSFSNPDDFLMTMYWLGQIGYVVSFLVGIFSLQKLIVEKLKGIEINSAGTFFLGVIYIQATLNNYIKKHEK